MNLLSGGKETIRIKTNSESKTTKPDDKEAMFQNRNSAVCQKSSEIRGLAVFNRPKRRLHAHSSLGRPWEVSAIQDRGKSVPISGDSIWANVSPSSFHKDTSPSPVVAKARMEGCVPIASRLNEHLVDNHLNETFQSAYRALHSTETALLKVKNDIMCALDQRRAVFVVLLDLSAAFDTVDYHIF